MRFAVVYKQEAPINAQYRALIPANLLTRRGHELVWSGTSSDRLPITELRRCDLVHVYRAADPRLIGVLKQLRGAGVALSWDNDDDITVLPKESPSYRKHGGLVAERDFVWQRRAIRLSHLVTTTSDGLAETYREAGGEHVAVIENYLPRDLLRGRRQGHDGLVVGWTAAFEHRVDAKRLDLPSVLLRTLVEHPHVRVITLGLKLDLAHERYEHRRAVDFLRMPNVLREFDIGLAPLADIPFNRNRSTVKVKEYGAAGVPWLASPVGQYAHLGPKQGGRLVADDEWYDAIDRLIRHRRERTLLRFRARLWAHQQVMRHNVSQWEREFEGAVERARAGMSAAVASDP